VSTGAAEWTYFAPDAQALLSDPFLDTHCFRLIEGGPDRAGLVGLAFEPTGQNERVSDISGTLWIDRASVELRWLEYTYENLEPEVRPGDATGRVEFLRMPEGTWIVTEWWIRMPLVQVDIGGRLPVRQITGFRQSGGRVLEVVEAGGRELSTGATAGAIEGIVVDSLGLPMEGVSVGTVGSAQTIFTNAEGRFNLVGLMEGTYRVRFMDPDLQALGLAAPEITQEVRRGVSSSVQFLMPSPAAMLRESCGAPTNSRMSMLGGIVRDASNDEPISGATVRVLWSLVESRGTAFRQVSNGLETTTDGFGIYRVCAVPRERRGSVGVCASSRRVRPHTAGDPHQQRIVG
jgi:hypothetical protein